RGPHLQLRMYVLRRLRRDAAPQRLPQLRRRLLPAAGAAGARAPARRLPRGPPGEHEAPPPSRRPRRARRGRAPPRRPPSARALSAAAAPRAIGVIVFDGVLALDVSGPLDVFATANAILAAAGSRPRYELRVLRVGRDERCVTESGLAIAAGERLERA